MNSKQKEKILNLREEGETYSEIAKKLSISSSTIRSFCSRSGIAERKQAPHNSAVCVYCGNELPKDSKTKPKKFCSSACRYRWWIKNNGVKNYSLICLNCNLSFMSKHKTQKYCSHRCYIEYRYRDGEVENG